MRVTYWQQNSGTKRAARVHLVNRSPDPITGVELRMTGYTTAVRDERRGYLVGLTLPPCTEFTYIAEKLVFTYWRAGRVLKEALVDWQAEDMDFTDGDGNSWRRTQISLLRIDCPGHPSSMSSIGYQGQPTSKQAVVCGSDG
ncbi:hypothetical protein ACFXMT_43310 [Streptomyces mirabilis]|uniref:hypothetical protein n=1 Tax=Streptomyces mirabilis TaxID=68239 RepID=UPI00367D9B7D